MINTISVKDAVQQKSVDSTYIILPFYKNSKPLESGKRWGMTLLKAGTMRFRWNETNPGRDEMLNSICNSICKSQKTVCTGSCSSEKNICDCKYQVVPLELIHSKDVIAVSEASDTLNLKADGIITSNNVLVPVVTVSDCVPVYFYDSNKSVFGVVHSGWKGTGIIGRAIELAVTKYNCSLENICVAIGPHIGQECYFVDEERAEYFVTCFGSKTIKKENGRNLLSLTEANLSVLKNAGVREENIVVAEDCTCCTTFDNGKNVFGSFRRQAAFLPPSVSADERSRSMTVQAAFVI